MVLVALGFPGPLGLHMGGDDVFRKGSGVLVKGGGDGRDEMFFVFAVGVASGQIAFVGAGRCEVLRNLGGSYNDGDR